MHRLSIYFMRIFGFLAVLNAIIFDFYHHLEWVNSFVQFGPVILFILYMIAGAFIASRLYKGEEPEEKKLGPFVYSMMITTFLTILFAMNIFVGEPRLNILNICNFEFWLFVVIMPIMTNIVPGRKKSVPEDG